MTPEPLPGKELKTDFCFINSKYNGASRRPTLSSTNISLLDLRKQVVDNQILPSTPLPSFHFWQNREGTATICRRLKRNIQPHNTCTKNRHSADSQASGWASKFTIYFSHDNLHYGGMMKVDLLDSQIVARLRKLFSTPCRAKPDVHLTLFFAKQAKAYTSIYRRWMFIIL